MEIQMRGWETDYVSYFEKRAAEMATAVNCQLLATSHVQVADGTEARMVAGVAIMTGENSHKGGRRPKRTFPSLK
jgi:hypothetical protein